MRLLKNLIERRMLDVNPLDPRWWPNTLNYKVNSGAIVSEETAMRISAVYACVNLLAWSVASLPWNTFKRLSQGKDLALDHQLYPIFYNSPNPEQNSFTFRSVAMAHVLLYGNAYAEIEFDKNGLPVALWPIPAWRTKPMRTAKGELFYRLTMPQGEIRNFPPYKIWHLQALGTDGIKGLSPIAQAREAMGLALATEEFGARFFGNGTNVGGVAEHPGHLSKQAYENLRGDLEEKYAGLGRSSRLMLLEEGMKFQKVGIPPEEAQFLQTRRFQLGEIARIYHVPPHMIGDLERATNNNIEQQSLEFVIYSLRPWLVNIEQETDRKLIYDKNYFQEFSVDALLRGDIKSRFAAYAIARQWGWLSADDIRALENLNPLPNGEGAKYLTPLNMVDAGSTQKQLQKPTQQNSLNYKLLFQDAVRKIAQREKQNILRAVKKHPNDLRAWLDDFYRDFPEFIERQLEPILGDKTGEFTRKYIEQSRSQIDEGIEAGLIDWEQKRTGKTILGG